MVEKKSKKSFPAHPPIPPTSLLFYIQSALDNHHHILTLLAQQELTETDRNWLLDHEQELRQLVQEQFIIALKAGVQPPSAHARAMLEQLAVKQDQLAAAKSSGQTPPVHTEAVKHDPPAAIRELHTMPVRRIRLLLTARAAAILLLIGTAAWHYFAARPKHEIVYVQPRQSYPDLPPGGNRAFLTLADGNHIVLDTTSNGTVARQGNIKISKPKDGSLTYDPEENAGPGSHAGSRPANNSGYNTITTPRGGQYHVSLSDGSQVWLNASSSIRFPTAFAKDRKVDITGEVYFEIAGDKSRPFLVNVNGTEVTVLGTSFNINAYSDEPELRTTLVAGAVQVVHDKEKVILRPGQQARIPAGAAILPDQNNRPSSPRTAISVMGHANVQQVMAWKNGAFNFQDAGLEEVMRQLARWYNLDVVYEKGIPKIEFYGSMDRSLTLASVLDGLQMSRVHVKVEGRKMTIMP